MSHAARTSRRGLLATPADVPILRALGTYAYLTADQLRRLYYGQGVITYVRARLRRLVESGYVRRLEPPHAGRAGSAANVFRLAPRGYRLLGELGIPAIRLPSERPASFHFYRHTLVLNDALLAAEKLTQQFPPISIRHLRHERDLHRQPSRAVLQDGRTATIVPDAYLQLHVAEPAGPGYVTNLLWEIDLGTRDQQSWRRKIEALQAYIEGPYRTSSGSDSVTLAMLTPLGERRQRELLRWTQAELLRLNRQTYAPLYCFTGLDPATVPPETLYFHPCWLQPFGTAPVPLVLRGEEAG